MGVSNLKRKAVNGFFWSMLESILSQGQGMIFGIFLARMLSPGEFGLVGMITIFISIAQVFVDSGLSQALIGKQQCTRLDKNLLALTPYQIKEVKILQTVVNGKTVYIK